jgi:5'(3')-deoxyribonucleotidase
MEKIDPKKADELLEVLSKKLNVPKAQLKKELEQGKFDSAIKEMNESQSEKFRQVMNNPKLVQKLISTPQAQALYKKITGKKQQ